jgi:hypothetical protein
MSLIEAAYTNHILASSPIPRVPVSVAAPLAKPAAAPPWVAPPAPTPPKAPAPVAKLPWLGEAKKRAEEIDDGLAALKAKRLAAQNTAALAAEARAREARREDLDRAFEVGAYAPNARRTTDYDATTGIQRFGVAK